MRSEIEVRGGEREEGRSGGKPFNDVIKRILSEGRWIPGRRRNITRIFKKGKERYGKEEWVEQTVIAAGLRGLWGARG